MPIMNRIINHFAIATVLHQTVDKTCRNFDSHKKEHSLVCHQSKLQDLAAFSDAVSGN